VTAVLAQPTPTLPAGATEGLRCYVYALRDPRDGSVFYVGKGRGERVYAHVRAALKARPTRVDPSRAVDSAKTARIREIVAAGRQVEYLVLRSGIETDEEAHVVEQAVIDAFAATGVLLTNLVAGHGSEAAGLSTVEAAAARVAAVDAPPFAAPAVIFMINKAWRADHGPDAIYTATRGHWTIGERSRERVVHAFGVARGVIRGAYVVDSWYSCTMAGEEHRWGFHGRPVPELAPWLGTSVRHLVPERGAQNPVRLFL
jgi:uncharacterized protein